MGKVKQMKETVEAMLFDIYKNIGIDKPENHDEIVDFVFNDVVETADPEKWHSGDVAIGFRRFMERLNCSWNLYVLFGGQATSAYEDEGIEAAVKCVNDGGGSVFHWNSRTNHPLELLSEGDGWDGYVEITKEEYDQF